MIVYFVLLCSVLAVFSSPLDISTNSDVNVYEPIEKEPYGYGVGYGSQAPRLPLDSYQLPPRDGEPQDGVVYLVDLIRGRNSQGPAETNEVPGDAGTLSEVLLPPRQEKPLSYNDYYPEEDRRKREAEESKEGGEERTKRDAEEHKHDDKEGGDEVERTKRDAEEHKHDDKEGGETLSRTKRHYCGKCGRPIYRPPPPRPNNGCNVCGGGGGGYPGGYGGGGGGISGSYSQSSSSSSSGSWGGGWGKK